MWAPPLKQRLVMLTCPGREKQAFETAEAFRRSGIPPQLDELIIYSDGRAELPQWMGGNWQHENLWDHSQGNLAAFVRILTLSRIHGVDYLFFVEDDVRPCKNALQRMYDVGVPLGCAFTTFFDMKEFYPGAPSGLYNVPVRGIDGRGFWGMQALCINGAVLREIFDSKHMHERRKDLKSHSDIVLMEAVEKLGFKYYAAHVPSLVEHVGHNSSSIWKFDEHGISRTATNFPGEDFDALALNDIVHL